MIIFFLGVVAGVALTLVFHVLGDAYRRHSSECQRLDRKYAHVIVEKCCHVKGAAYRLVVRLPDGSRVGVDNVTPYTSAGAVGKITFPPLGPRQFVPTDMEIEC